MWNINNNFIIIINFVINFNFITLNFIIINFIIRVNILTLLLLLLLMSLWDVTFDHLISITRHLTKWHRLKWTGNI